MQQIRCDQHSPQFLVEENIWFSHGIYLSIIGAELNSAIWFWYKQMR